MDYEECCGNCKYHRMDYETGEWVCTCKDSELYTFETPYDEDCMEWEGMK
ncbi:MAG: hypothetical protein LUD72_07195 [Bacteroidales bacterium]|nr:hypothetical protein [Bacteroidales bacterium]